MIAKVLMVASAAILLVLGVIHLAYTFYGRQLTPRDSAVQNAMEQVSPVLTRQTTMWKAWVGFNASHSMGAILFGLLYGYLALLYDEMLFNSWFLRIVGLAMLIGLLILAKRYWFNAPFRIVCVSIACYVGALATARPA